VAWEISTACDIRLGRLFGPGGSYEGQRLEINDSEISRVLDRLGTDTSDGRMLFEVVHDEALPPYGIGGTTPVPPPGSRSCRLEEALTHVQVSIGGGIKAALVDDEKNGRIEALARTAGLERRTLAGSKRLETAIHSIAYDNPALLPQALVQETCMHELQHAVDQQDHRRFVMEQTRQAAYMRLGALVSRSALPARAASAAAAYGILAGRYDAGEMASGLGALAATVAVGGISRRLQIMAERRSYRDSPSEQRARQAESLSVRFNEIISIK
jgi:hypothetical protein